MEQLRCVATIERLETKNESGNEYTTYIINVQNDGNQWQISHRYSEFNDLKNILMQIPPKYNFPDFPSKRPFSSTSINTTDQRRLKFSRFLNLIVQQPLYFNTPEVKQFLGFPEPKNEPVVRPPPLFASKLNEKRPREDSNQRPITIVKVDSTELQKPTKALPLIPGDSDTQTIHELTPGTPETSQSPQSPQTPTLHVASSSDELIVNKPKVVSIMVDDANKLDDNELKRYLLKGDVFLKYSLDGQQHNRFVCVLEDFTEIVWKDPKKDMRLENIKKEFRIHADSILEVNAGQKNGNFFP